MPEGLDRIAEVLAFLQGRGIPYTVLAHEPVFTIAQCLEHPEIAAPGGAMPRNLFLANRQGTEFWLLLLSPLAPFRTAVVSKLLGVSRLSFAPETLLPGMLGLESGAVSPLGLLFDGEKKVSLVMDRALLGYDSLWFHPCVNTASLRLSTPDFLGRFLPALGREARIIELPPQGD
jgi:Ala-tRNA(Pro) deacylase